MKIILQFLLLQILFLLSVAFTKAPGTLTLTIKIPELIDGCLMTEEECRYNLEFCIGSGISINEQCLWLPKKTYDEPYHENQDILAHESFEVDNIRSSFYFNANLTFQSKNKTIKDLRFKDHSIQYDAVNGTHTLSVHSKSFVSITIEITVKCKLGFYPQFQCNRACFAIPEISKCNTDGYSICLKGYTLQAKSGECVKDDCASDPTPCNNGATCNYHSNVVQCICRPDYYGNFCEIWNPCMKHYCKNSGKCVKRESTKDYFCQCDEEYTGKYCEFIKDPCKKKLCPLNTVCEKKENNAICLKSHKSESKIDNIGWFLNDKNEKSEVTASITMKTAVKLDENEIRNRETVKLIQYPVQKDFTTISIIIVLLVFIMCCFGITLWMQRYKYFQKRKKYNIYPNIPAISPVINMPTYRSADENFKRWHSLDDNSFYVCHEPHNEQYSTMSYKSGTNLWPRCDNSNDSYKNWPLTFKTRMPMMNETSTFGSGDVRGNLCESTQNDSEKMEDYMADCVVMDNEELPVHITSFS